jgi:hypothetical protein
MLEVVRFASGGPRFVTVGGTVQREIKEFRHALKVSRAKHASSAAEAKAFLQKEGFLDVSGKLAEPYRAGFATARAAKPRKKA